VFSSAFRHLTFSVLQEVTPFRLSPQVHSALERLDRVRDVSQQRFQLSRADLVKIAARVKHMNVMDVAEAMALTLEATAQPLPNLSLKVAVADDEELKLHTTESDRLFEQAHKTWQKSLSSVPDDAESLFQWGRSFYQQAKRKLQLWKNLVREQQKVVEAHVAAEHHNHKGGSIDETPGQSHLLDSIELEILRLLANALKKYTAALSVDARNAYVIEVAAAECLFHAAVIKCPRHNTDAHSVILDAGERVRTAVEHYVGRQSTGRRKPNKNASFVEDIRSTARRRYECAGMWIGTACTQGASVHPVGENLPKKPMPLRFRTAHHNTRNMFAVSRVYIESAVQLLDATLISETTSKARVDLCFLCAVWMTGMLPFVFVLRVLLWVFLDLSLSRSFV
jgi:tetratricopeptide (TPR) repeat protein